MLGDLGSNLFIVKTTTEEDKKRLEEIISDWALSKGYERLPDEYMTRDNFEASEKVINIVLTVEETADLSIASKKSVEKLLADE